MTTCITTILIYFIITGTVFICYTLFLHFKRNNLLKYDASERILIKDLQVDALTFSRSFPVWNNPLFSKFWIQETHRLDRLLHLDKNCNLDGNQILSLLYTWASQKQFLDNSQVSINYNLEFCDASLGLQKKELILSIASYYIRKLNQNKWLGIDLKKINKEAILTIEFENEMDLLPLKNIYLSTLQSLNASHSIQGKTVKVIVVGN